MAPRPEPEPNVEASCACCAKTVPRAEDLTSCGICRRPTCLACLRPYGHYMQVCEECRLAEWR